MCDIIITEDNATLMLKVKELEAELNELKGIQKYEKTDVPK